MSKFLEKYLPPVFGVLVGILVWKYNIMSFEDCEDLLRQFPPIGSIVFGFVLTMFSLIIQSNSDAIIRMRQRTVPFNRLVAYNKKVVLFSLVFTFFCYFFGYFEIPTCSFFDINKFIVSIFCGALIFYILLVIYFLLIFYILISENNDKSE